MKKHIIISGVPRAGKSTVSRLISKAYGYQHISMDSIIAGIEKTFPETGIDSDANDVSCFDNVLRISSKIAPFIRAMTDSGEYDELDYGMVIDVFQLLPSDYVKETLIKAQPSLPTLENPSLRVSRSDLISGSLST